MEAKRIRPTRSVSDRGDRPSITACAVVPDEDPAAPTLAALPTSGVAERVIRIVIVAQHSLTREMLHESLDSVDDFTVVADVSCGEAAERIALLRPDVALFDIDGVGNSSVDITQSLIEACRDTAIAVLSPIDVGDALYDLVAVGVRCFLDKGVSRSELISAIRSATTEGTRVTLNVPREFLTSAETSDAGSLSDREVQVLRLVAQALTNRQIANALSITEGTVKRHLRSIFVKLGAVSRIDAVNRYRAVAERGEAASG